MAENAEQRLTFGELQAAVGEWSRRNFPNNEPLDPLLGLQEELGELSHAVLKERQRIRRFADPEYALAAKVDAVADIVIYLADFCERNGIDLQEAVETTWNRVSKRDWQANPDNAAEVAGD